VTDTVGILTVDIGSSSLRVSLFDGELNLIDTLSEKCATEIHPDVEAYWASIEAMARRLVGTHGSLEVRAIGVSALVGWVFVDERGLLVAPVFSWMDQRKVQQHALLKAMDGAEFSDRTGRRLSAEQGGLKLRYLKDDLPGTYGCTARMLSIKDYINFRFCGIFGMDHTTACYTALFNVHDLSWDEAIIRALDVDAAKLPRLFAGGAVLGTVLPEVAGSLGLSTETVVVTCGPDGSVAVLGAGGVKPGDAVSVMGTSDVFFAVSSERVLDADRHLVTNPHVLSGLWLIGGPLGMAGGALEWYASTLLDGRYTLDQLNALGVAVPPGADDLLFLPSLTGERTPFWNPAVRGTVAGLTRDHGPGHLFRALMEANSFAIRRILDVLDGLGVPVEHISAIGGGADSELWLRIKADVCGVRVDVPQSLEATTRGCALLAWRALNGKKPLPETPPLRRSLEAEPVGHARYARSYARYLRLMALAEAFYASD